MMHHHICQEQLIKAAESKGISVADKQADWIQDIVAYSKNGKTEIISEGMVFGSTSGFSKMICDDRHIAKQLLSAAGIPVPHGVVFKLEEEEIDEEALRKITASLMATEGSFVCRPAYGTGRFAQNDGIRDFDDLTYHLGQYIEDYATWLLEEAHVGSPLEILVIGGKVRAAIVREELGLLGNGESSLEELMDVHNAQASEDEKLEINAESRQWMREQNVYLSDIVPTGKRVILKGGEGSGKAVNVLAQIHADYADWASKIAEILNRPVFSLEISCTSPEAEPKMNAVVLDIDGNADWSKFELDGAALFASYILDFVFP